MYECLDAGVPLSQGDILDDCPLFTFSVSPSTTDFEEAPIRTLARVVVLTQACDLAQGKLTRILVASVRTTGELVAQKIVTGSVIRDQVRRGQVYGWYFLPAAPDPIHLPESLVNLHELHTVTLAVLNRLIVSGKRLCRIQTPYREHLAQHFAVTYMRIGLPEPYETQP